MQDEIIASVGEHVDTAGVRIEQKLLKGRSADTLIAAAEGADMLVVGNRGRGGFRGLLLGSVSQQIAHHATCPVVIVRADMDLDEGR
jgi:nucleotide-binding universal stress UspA family protein